jgi:hypothetical protein
VVPGNVMPIAPGAHLLGLARLLNRMMRKSGDQADRQKMVTLASRAASQNVSTFARSRFIVEAFRRPAGWYLGLGT